MRPTMVRTVAKERFSYLLRLRFARSAARDLLGKSGAVNLLRLPRGRLHKSGISLGLQWIPGSSLRDAPE